MIKQLKIKNFRCYKESTITFNGTSILVGKNNAGKSTMIEALKVISSVTKKYKTLRFIAPPTWVGKNNEYGVSPNVENMNISDRGIFNMYGNPPAIIEAKFINGTSIKAYVGEGLSIFAIIYNEKGSAARNSREAKLIDIPIIEVLPQISAVLDTEKVLKKATVDNNKSTRLASRNFRNQLFYYEEAFPKFKDLVESTWENLIVSPIESSYTEDGRMLHFYVRIGAFEAEISWMGHGLQMWIQTMWFISQCDKNAIVVLDEPDVYMHADLQRRLVRLITPMFSQLIVATHSLEIIEEVTSNCIIPIDSSKKTINPIGEDTSLQFISKNLGSPFNIDLARIFISNQFLIWNGDDSSRKILSEFQSVLFPKDLYPLINLPKVYLDNWDKMKKVLLLADLFSQNNIEKQLICILKPDYHTIKEAKQCINEAKKHKIDVHIWGKKEVENYAINRDVIYRYISKNMQKGKISDKTIDKAMNDIAKKMMDEVKEQVTFDNLYCNYKKPFDIISGREFFNNLSIWTQQNYGISINARQIIPYFQTSEVPIEIKKIISLIMNK